MIKHNLLFKFTYGNILELKIKIEIKIKIFQIVPMRYIHITFRHMFPNVGQVGAAVYVGGTYRGPLICSGRLSVHPGVVGTSVGHHDVGSHR